MNKYELKDILNAIVKMLERIDAKEYYSESDELREIKNKISLLYWEDL